MLLLAGFTPAAGILWLRAGSRRTWQAELVAYVLKFPRGLDPSAVVAFISGLSGVVASHWERPVATRAVVLEVNATPAGINHHLVVPRSLAQVVLSALRAALPSVTAREDANYHLARPVLAAELGLNDHNRSLATDRAGAVSSAILASLQPLMAGEQLVVQCALSPLGPVSASHQPPPAGLWQVFSGQAGPSHKPDKQAVKAAHAKQARPLFAATLRIGVAAPPMRARSLLLRALAAFHTANAPGVHLHRLDRSSEHVGGALIERRLPLLTWPCTLNAAELAGLVAFPLGTVALPGLQLGGTRLLAPAADIPSRGRIIGEATFPGAERPLGLSVEDSRRHLHVIGPTGSGKSTLLLGLITQDMAAGRGVVVLDPKGDLVSDVLDRVPAHRLDDVCILDPADEERPVGLNLLAASEGDRELVTEQVVGTLHNLYQASWGQRTDDILRSAVLTLVGAPGMTLAEIPLLLTDASFRRRLVGRLDDPIALGPFWAAYEAWSDGERAQAIGPVMNKLRAFLLRRRLRNVLGQAHPRLNLDWALNRNKILLVPLAKGVLGEEAAALIGSLVVARVWQAVQRRSMMPQDKRPTTFGFIDEFQDYLKLPMSVADILAQARGLGLGLALAHQNLDQLPTSLQKAVLANARSRVIFQTSAGDAHSLARELAPYLSAEDLQGLGAYEIVATLSAGARIAPPVTGRTLLPPPVTGLAEEAHQRSRERYGRDRADVEAAIRARHEGRAPGGGLGRREVRS
ncbi:type IV secretion system DNA-binding domain-containing protein [Kibdelosporangium philippinense]|uniref:Type IV secretion system DNA-binding domain-containing protein n=1 Tax=Kibdelosporangium philippinense TaxID=211113 RepID=A0ABS8ZGD0_9PSEU|nr:type IV secretion system DNA-binding domain-containing protein [Kibdelosporangium philippinense]MCE7006602.1 type IV secretion system DNA-binding domain-containing protein [Kibdelosporangium philippinense]